MRLVSVTRITQRGFASVTVVLLMLAGFAAAQTAASTGTVQGSVTDETGTAISEAKVTITNQANAQTTSVKTDASGNFTSGALNAGDYVVRVDSKQFISANRLVKVEGGVTTPANFKLGQEPLPGIVTAKPIEDLPLNGRNFLTYIQLEPGIQNQDGSTLDPSKSGFSSVSLGGRSGRAARIEADGLDVTDETVGTTTLNIPASAIQEFQLGELPADISAKPLSLDSVNMVTRSGANDLHGEAFGFYRNGGMGSASLPGGGSPSWERQQFGGNLGGALIKDKLFWFIDAERNRQDAQNPVLLGGPFIPSVINIREPLRELESTNRLDYQISKTTRAFYRFSYDQNSDVIPFNSGPSMQPLLSRTNTPSHALGVDFNSRSFTHSIRFEYLKFRNAVSDSSSEVSGFGNQLPNTTIDIGGGATSQCMPGSLYCSGPSYLGPQQTYQSDRQFKYDGGHLWGAHNLQYGLSFNHILGGGFASLFALSPTLADGDSTPLPAGVLGSMGDPADPLNYPVEWSFIGNGQGFASERAEFGLPAGGQRDNRLAAYLGDTWKAKPNLVVNYGVNWVRDDGRTDSDLAPIPQLNAWGTGLGNRIRQPNFNFAPRLGVAWTPTSSGKTSLRGGIGLSYNSAIFNNLFFDRPLRLSQGQFLSTPAVCVGGAPGSIQWPTNAGTAGTFIAGGAGIVNADGTVSATWCGDSIRMAAPQAVLLQQAYKTATAAAGTGANPTFIGNSGAFAGPNQNGLSLLAPNYETPRAVHMNLGLQHEFRPGLLFTLDLLRDVGTHSLLGVDVNHGGAAATFNVLNADADRDAAQVLNGCTAGTNQVGCMIAKLGPAGALAAYGAAGIGGPAQVTGGAPCPSCAFPGLHPNLGVNVMNFPDGRSVYNAVDLSLKQQMTKLPLPGVEHASFQLAYSHSRYVSQVQDSDFVNQARDFTHPNRFTGPSALDRTHQFSFAGDFDLPRRLRLGMIAHVSSPLPATLAFQQNSGGAEVLVTDWTGDGSTGDIIPGSNVGSYMRSIKPGGLSNFIKSYNTNIAGSASPQTPAGNALINGGVFSLQDLKDMGGVLQPLAATVQNPTGLGWLKTFDLKLSWVYRFQDRVTFEPSVGAFNVFNFASFDMPGNTQSGVLNFGAGSVSPAATFTQPQSTVGGTSANTKDPTGRTNRASLQSGTNPLGAPRALEVGVKLSF